MRVLRRLAKAAKSSFEMPSKQQYDLVTTDDYDPRIPVHSEEAFEYGISFPAKWLVEPTWTFERGWASLTRSTRIGIHWKYYNKNESKASEPLSIVREAPTLYGDFDWIVVGNYFSQVYKDNKY